MTSFQIRLFLILLLSLPALVFQNCTQGFQASNSSSSYAPGTSSLPFTAPVAVSAFAALSCPVGFTYTGGLCIPPTEGSKFGTIFGILYTTLHCPYASGNSTNTPIYDTAQILAGLASFGPIGSWNWKSQPPDGYYCLTTRDDILRKHAIELRDAGVSFVYIDASNHPSSDENYSDRPTAMILQPMAEMLKVWSTIPGAPRIVPFTLLQQGTPSPMIDAMMAQLAQYPQMQLIRNGKPFFLVAANPTFTTDQTHLAALAQQYSYSQMWQSAAPGFNTANWSFESFCASPNSFNATSGLLPCNQFVTSVGGAPEHIAISPAINAYIFSLPSQATPRYSGRTFAQQFATVYNNPTVKYATFADWNSWLAIDFCMYSNGTLSPTPGDPKCIANTHEFVDTYTDELSRDLEPTTSQGDLYYRMMKGCMANYRRGLPCDQTITAQVASVTFGSTLADDVARACTLPSETNVPSSPSAGMVSGNVENLTVVANRVILNGWICTVGSSAPTTFQVYLGAPSSGGGFQVLNATTTMVSEAAVQSACQNGAGALNRYSIDVTNLMNSYPGQRLYVQSANNYVQGSGHCAVPWPEAIPAGP